MTSKKVGAGLAKLVRTQGKVAEQIERIGIWLLGSVGKLIEADTTLDQQPNNLASLYRIGPLRPKCRCGRPQRANSVRCIVRIADDAKLLPVPIEVVDQVGRDLYGSLIASGAGNPQAPIPGISNRMNFRRVFMETQDQAIQAKFS